MRINLNKVNWAAIAAFAAIVLTAAYDQIVPRDAGLNGKAKSVAELQKEYEAKKQEYDALNEQVKGRTWQVAQDQIGPKAMDWVSKQALANFVQVNAFRPQRSVDAAGMAQLNYLLTAEGSFPNVLKFIRAFESSGSLMAIKMVQIASADGSTDAVRATIGIVTYQEAKSGK